MKRDFLTLSDLSKDERSALLRRAAALKQARAQRHVVSTLAGRTLVLIFEKASTRTRLSFEAAMLQLGGHAITLPIADSQLGRGEPLSDTARVISGYADAVMVRTFADARLREFARHSRIPVINGLTDGGHPVQLLADLMTIEERLGRIAGRTVAFIGDGSCNMAHSWVEAAGLFDFNLRIAAPLRYSPSPASLALSEGRVTLHTDPLEAARGADVLATDVWTSMGQEAEVAARRTAFAGFCIDQTMLEAAAAHAIVLHCLPAHRGEEISAEVLEGPRSAAWDEAENRMHVQKALLETLILDVSRVPRALVVSCGLEAAQT